MTERLSDVENRIHTVHKLSAVISAMRGIAAARAREAHRALDGIREYAQTIGTGIGHALSFLPQGEPAGAPLAASGAHAIVVLCAEQGFAGAFSAHVLDAALGVAARNAEQTCEMLIIGDRGLLVADETAVSVGWSAPMIAHTDQAATLAHKIVEALYQRLEGDQVSRVTLVYARPDTAEAMQVIEKPLVPFDFSRFPLPPTAISPLITLPPQTLLTRLVEEYVFAELSEAVMLSFAAENEARMRAMIAAHGNVSKSLDELISRSRQLRQDEITDEIIELAVGVMTGAD